MASDTMLAKVYTLNNFIKYTKLNDVRKISNQMIISWIDAQSMRGNVGRTINNRLVHLKAFLRWQREMNLVMPKLQLSLIPHIREMPPRKIYFTRDQVSRVLDVASLLEWLLISLAFDCGLRITELRNLRLSDLHHNRINIIGKGQKRRYAYLSPQVIRHLTEWMNENQIVDFLQPSPICPDRPLAVCTIREYMRNAFKRAGFTNFCPHDLRHSYATDLKCLGVSTRQIQAGLGHSTEKITEQYLSDLDGYDLIEMYRVKYAAKTNSRCNSYNNKQRFDI